MKICSFFGSRFILDRKAVEEKIYTYTEHLIQHEGVDTFLLGEMGDFEIIAGSCVEKLKKIYPHISRVLVFCYAEQFHQKAKVDADDFDYPLAVERCKRRGRIIKRNRLVVDQSDYIIFYIDKTYGGSYQTFQYAIKKKKNYINLCDENMIFNL